MPPPHAHRSAVAFWPVLTWLLLQLAALTLSACRIPLSARFPAPEEELACHLLLAVQTSFSALLFPFLFRNLATGWFIVATAPIFTLVAAAIGGLTSGHGLERFLFFAPAWLAGLLAWSLALKTPRARQYGSAIAVFLVLGMALLAYLHREFGAPAQTFDWSKHSTWGPLMGGIAVLEAPSRSGTAWVFLGSFLLAGLVAWGSDLLTWRKRGQTGTNPSAVTTAPHQSI